MDKHNITLPWSLQFILIWFLGFFFLSIVLGLLMVNVINWIDSGLTPKLNPIERFTYINLPSHFIYYCLANALVFIALKRSSISFCDIIGSLEILPIQIVLSCSLGMALMAANITTHYAIYGFYWNPTEFRVGPNWIWVFMAELITLSFLAGMTEEVVFRGILYRTIRRKMTFVKAAIFSTLIFLMFHVSYIADPIFSAYIFFVGMGTAWLFDRTDSLLPCIGFHVFGNVAERTAYYYLHYL